MHYTERFHPGRGSEREVRLRGISRFLKAHARRFALLRLSVRHPDCRKCGYVIVQATTSALVPLRPFDVGVGRLVFNMFLPLR